MAKKAQTKKTGLGNRGHLKVLNKHEWPGPVNPLGSIWYSTKPLEIPYSTNKFLGWDFFFNVSYCQTALDKRSSCTQNSRLYPLINCPGQGLFVFNEQNKEEIKEIVISPYVNWMNCWWYISNTLDTGHLELSFSDFEVIFSCIISLKWLVSGKYQEYPLMQS